MLNQIEFKVYGKYALFSDPLTRIGGEKCSYQIPTYEALKGIVKAVYWKPTLIWLIDEVRIMRPIRLVPKNMKLIKYHEAGADLSVYTYLQDVEYQVKAHFEWNMYRPDMSKDRIDGKHYEIARRMIDRGGRRDPGNARDTWNHAGLEKERDSMTNMETRLSDSCSMVSIIRMKREKRSFPYVFGVRSWKME